MNHFQQKGAHPECTTGMCRGRNSCQQAAWRRRPGADGTPLWRQAFSTALPQMWAVDWLQQIQLFLKLGQTLGIKITGRGLGICILCTTSHLPNLENHGSGFESRGSSPASLPTPCGMSGTSLSPSGSQFPLWEVGIIFASWPTVAPRVVEGRSRASVGAFRV